MLTRLEAVTDIAAKEAKHFTVFDAIKPYHQYPLVVEIPTLTTFITPFDGFKYLRAPYGLSFIADHSNYRIVEIFEGLLGLIRVVDDIVITDKDEVSHVDNVRQFSSYSNAKAGK